MNVGFGAKPKVRRFATELLNRPVALRLLMFMDSFVLRAALYKQRPGGEQHVILTSPGEGNIGDQAMFESFAGNVSSPVVAVVKSPEAYSVPRDERFSNIKLLVLPSLVYSKLLSHYRDLWLLGRSVRGARSFSVMGADIMDGGYGKHSSMVEWNIAAALQRSGIPSRILGFSWNGEAQHEIVRLARNAGRVGVLILPRDPDSLERLQADGVSNVEQASDMVFAWKATSEPISPRLPEDLAHKKLAVVNVSGLIGLRVAQDVEYENFLETLESLGYTTIFVPHVSHSNVDDIMATRRLREFSAIARRAHFIDELASPSEVQALVKKAQVVVTGRMHLSILALAAETPVVVLATQGKVSGLMKSFGIPHHCVEPVEGFGAVVAKLIMDLENNRENVVNRIRQSLPEIKELAVTNFPKS